MLEFTQEKLQKKWLMPKQCEEKSNVENINKHSNTNGKYNYTHQFLYCTFSIIPKSSFLEDKPKQTKNYTCNPRRNIAAGTSTGLELFLAKISEEDSLDDGQLDPNGTRVSISAHKISSCNYILFI